LGVAPVTFDKVYRPKLGSEDEKTIGRRVWIRGRGVVEAFAEVFGGGGGAESRGGGERGGGEDELGFEIDLDQEMGDWSEAYKREMTLLKRFERSKLEARLTTVDEMRGGIERVASEVRAALELAMRSLSVGDREALEERLDRVDGAIDDLRWERG
jgi:hypothetical protein